MRMWMVNPKFMCRNHLLGEHLEIHMLVGTIKKGVSVKGYMNKGVLEAKALNKRHDELVEEITKRGYNHKSPLNSNYTIPEIVLDSKVNKEESLKELIRRCPKCKELYENHS